MQIRSRVNACSATHLQHFLWHSQIYCVCTSVCKTPMRLCKACAGFHVAKSCMDWYRYRYTGNLGQEVRLDPCSMAIATTTGSMSILLACQLGIINDDVVALWHCVIPVILSIPFQPHFQRAQLCLLTQIWVPSKSSFDLPSLQFQLRNAGGRVVL